MFLIGSDPLIESFYSRDILNFIIFTGEESCIWSKSLNINAGLDKFSEVIKYEGSVVEWLHYLKIEKIN